MGLSVLSVTLTASVLMSSENPLRRADAHTWNGGFSVTRHQTLVRPFTPSSTIQTGLTTRRPVEWLSAYGNEGDRPKSLLDAPIPGVG